MKALIIPLLFLALPPTAEAKGKGGGNSKSSGGASAKASASSGASSSALATEPQLAVTPSYLDTKEVAVYIEYQRTGQEQDELALKQGQTEVENSNPCVLKMRRDVQAFTKREELADAVKAVTKNFDDPKPRPRLTLHFMNEAMELRFELWTPPKKYSDGVIYEQGHRRYRKAVYITDQPGSWQERMDADQCHVSEEKFIALVDELREADRLVACVARKRDLLGSSAKISNYIHNYLPPAWLDEARRRLTLQAAPVNDLLRADTTFYRQGNSSFRDCLRGLKLLEEEASASVRLLNEVRDEHKGTDVPEKEIDELEHELSGIIK